MPITIHSITPVAVMVPPRGSQDQISLRDISNPAGSWGLLQEAPSGAGLVSGKPADSRWEVGGQSGLGSFTWCTRGRWQAGPWHLWNHQSSSPPKGGHRVSAPTPTGQLALSRLPPKLLPPENSAPHSVPGSDSPLSRVGKPIKASCHFWPL